MKETRVVLADDHAVLRAGLRLLIESQKDMAVVGEAADGPEAVRRARRVRPDLVVLDLAMPRTDPVATIRQLLRLGVRTVVLTMHDDDAYVAAALEAGALGYVVKKAADVELLSAIRAVGKGRRFLTARGAGARRSKTVAPAGFRRLSAREAEVLRLIAYGFTNREIAGRLRLSIKTVETFRARICEKLGLRSRADLVRHALRMGLVANDERDPGIGT
jgi:two-component system, NarL family, response regulator NreC